MPRFPHVSPASQGLTSGVYQALRALAEAHAPEVFALNVGDTYLPPPVPLADGIGDPISGDALRYAPVQGCEALLDAFSTDLSRHGAAPARECLQVVPGATHGLTLACAALLGDGDELLLPAPYWPLIRGIASSVGGHAVQVPLGHLEAAPRDLEASLEAAVTARTAVVYLNSPHNPTGAVWSEAQLETLGRVAERHGLWVLCDQAYEELVYTPRPAPPAWRHPALEPRAVVAHTLSKSHALSGARVGLLHGPAEAMSAIRALSTFQMYCAARPMQALASRALSAPATRAWQAEARTAYARAGAMAADVLAVPAPNSGSFLFFDTRPLRRADESARGFLERCARAGIVLTEGHACGDAYGDWARLCFTAVPPDALERALCALKQVLRAK